MRIESELVFRLLNDAVETAGGDLRRYMLQNDLGRAQVALAQEMAYEKLQRSFRWSLESLERAAREQEQKERAQNERRRQRGREGEPGPGPKKDSTRTIGTVMAEKKLA